MLRTGTLAIAILLACAVPPAGAHSFSLLRTFADPTPDKSGELGGHRARGLVALGHLLLVGEPLQDLGELDDAGVIYVFDVDTGRLVRTLTNPSAHDDDYLGADVATIGGLVVAPLQGRGVVLIFDPGTGEVVRTFGAPNSIAFGSAVAAAGANLLVGANNTYVGGVPSGAVYRMDPSSGAVLRTYLNPNAAEYDWFGSTVEPAGPDVLATAVGDDAVGPDEGAVYLLDGGTGAVKQKFLPPSPDTQAPDFGGQLVVLRQTLIVSEPGDDTGATNAGAVHLFDMATGAVIKTVTSPNPAAYGRFGAAIAVVDGLIYIGAPGEPLGPGSGRIYVFDATGTYRETILAPRFAAGWGSALASMGHRLVVASPTENVDMGYVAAVDVFEPCGDGSVAGIEQCDDGNTVSGDGCSASCRIETCGPTPSSGCLVGSSGGLGLDPDRVIWSWRGRGAFPADLGDPTTTTSYVLCVWDATAAPQPRLTLAAPAGGVCSGKSCWTRPGGGFYYLDREGTPDGVFKMKLKASATGAAKVSLRAQGPHLTLPAIDYAPTTRVQLRSTTSNVCWETGLK